MRRLLAISALLLCASPAFATSYYFSSSAGSDSAGAGTIAAPWASITKLNTLCETIGFFKPGDAIFLKGGDVFRDDYLRCGDTQNPASGATISTVPMYFAGTQAAPITIGSYGTGNYVIDAADPMALSWKVDTADDSTGNTYSAPLGGFTLPAKVFMDNPLTESPQVLPVPNYVGAEFNGTHPYLSAVTNGSGIAIYGEVPSTDYSSVNALFDTAVPGNDTDSSYGGQQWFAQANTGVQNVVACANQKPTGVGVGVISYPGCWYSDGTTIWINLGGANPNAHTFEGTHRPYGALLRNSAWITVSGGTFIHSQFSAMLAFEHANNSTWFTTDGIQFTNDKVFNYGGLQTNDPLGMATGNEGLVGGIVVRDDFNHYHAPVGVRTTNDYIGMADNYFGMKIIGLHLFNLNGAVGSGNYIRTYVADGFNVEQPNIGQDNIFTQNEATLNMANGFANILGGQLTFNFIHETYGEGVQAGGSRTNTAADPVLIQHNRILNEERDYSSNLYNDLDCNGDAGNSGMDISHNTFGSGWGAGITQESPQGQGGKEGCFGNHVHDNIIDMAHPYYPNVGQFTGINVSPALYIDSGNMNGSTFDHNLYIVANSGVDLAAGDGGQPSGAAWLSMYEPTSVFLTAEPASMFVDYSTNNLNLTATSPARGMGTNGGDVGALPYVSLNPVLQLMVNPIRVGR